MTITHLCNAFLERELSQMHPPSLTDLLKSHTISLQLQFLPLLYRKPSERLLITEFPPKDYLYFLEEKGIATDSIDLIEKPLAPFNLNLWAPSKVVENWATKNGGSLTLPDWETVQTIHSKIFSFSTGSPIPGSRLLLTPEDAQYWASQLKGPKVIKKAFGASGSGHFCFEDTPISSLGAALFDQRLPVIGEPWVERVFDFSTQWDITDTIHYLGATVLKTDSKGTYLGTLAGDESELFKEHARALQEHIDECMPLLHKIRSMGFFGNLGIDAFVYLWQGKRRLRAVSEINARKTMGWAALTIQKLHFPKHILHLRFEKTTNKGFLPSELGKRAFQRQLLLDLS